MRRSGTRASKPDFKNICHSGFCDSSVINSGETSKMEILSCSLYYTEELRHGVYQAFPDPKVNDRFNHKSGCKISVKFKANSVSDTKYFHHDSNKDPY